MDETSEKKSSRKLVDTSNNGKKKLALSILTNSFTQYLQDIMRRVNFDLSEKELHHPTFKRYMLLTISKSAKNLYDLKYNLSKLITEVELTVLKRLIFKTEKIELEPKVDHALKLFGSDLPRYLKNLMHKAGYLTSETEENNDCYVSFFSSVITSLTTLFIRVSSLKPDFHISSQNKKRKAIKIDPPCNDDKETVKSIQSRMSTTKLPWPPHSSSSIQLIASTKKHFIYSLSNNSYEDIVIKVIKSEAHAAKDVKNLDNEFEIGKKILHPSLRYPFERKMYQNKQALLLEWAKGVPISEIDFVKSYSLGFFLEVAREIVSSLLAMHMKHIMHMNITCEHIIFNPESKSLKLIGYGSSSSSGGKKSCFSNEELLEKDLRYISPEQTGRVNREIDFRSDFYSLGIVLYRLLSGKYPFESNDALKLVHMHILKEPVKVNTINPNVPVPISDMIFKLMKKSAEERYASAKGIIHDLDLMISEYVSDEKLTSVILQQHDIPETLLLPQKLYGRCTQYNSLLSVLDRVTPTSFEIVLVSGDSGTGKSSLVLELYKSIALRDGIFIYGKFHHSKCEPYSGLLEAINNFCDDILLKDETTIASYKRQIQDSVGDEGSILTNFISNLQLLIGHQRSISDSFGQDAKNRFIYVFVKFIKAICSVGSPIFLVLEDLHWLDLESYNLLSSLLTDKSNKNLIFLGTYRENEATNNTTDRLLEDVRKMTVNVTQIKLDTVDHETINELISDAFYVSPLETYSLTAFLYEKTKGNLFFLMQMLRSLSEQGSIFFCNDGNRWKWEATIFNETHFSKTSVELVSKKILSLDNDTQDTLKIASCLGCSFSIGILKHLVKSNKCIEGAISAGMITQQKGSNTRYRFAHDQIQQAAFLLTSKNTKETFWSIGHKLWISFSSKELDDNIFIVARLLYHAISIISDQNERFKIASLFMQAGNKAMTSTAFEQAFKYLNMGTQLLDEECWKSHYNLTLELHNVTAKAAYCNGDFERMNAMIEEISKNVLSTLQLVPSYSLQIKQFLYKRMFEEAIRTAICILEKLGENVHMNPVPSMITYEIMRARRLVDSLPDKKISELKVLEDEVILSVMVILSDIVYSSFLVNHQLLCVVSSKMTVLTFKYGISKYSAYGLCAFGCTLCSQGDKLGYRCGLLALILLKKMQAKEFTPMVYGIFYCMISPWYSSVHEALVPLKEMHSIGLEIGSQESTSVGALSYCMYAFLSGTNLATLLDDIEEFKSSLSVKSKLFLCINQAVLNIHEVRTKNPAIVIGELFDYRVCYDENEKGYDISRCLVICILTAYIFNDYALALKLVEACKPLSKYISSFFMNPIFLFYEGLVYLASVRYFEQKKEKEMLVQHAKENIAKLRKMSEGAPENYLNKVHLLEAELAVVHNNKSQAISYFQSAISLSTKHRFPHEEAIACERAGMYFLHLDSLQCAAQSLSQSFACYKKWGATAKLKDLSVKYSFLLKRVKKTSNAFDNPELNQLEVENNSMASISILSETPPYEKMSKGLRKIMYP